MEDQFCWSLLKIREIKGQLEKLSEVAPLNGTNFISSKTLLSEKIERLDPNL